jgi:hypothetical protein
MIRYLLKKNENPHNHSVSAISEILKYSRLEIISQNLLLLLVKANIYYANIYGPARS